MKSFDRLRLIAAASSPIMDSSLRTRLTAKRESGLTSLPEGEKPWPDRKMQVLVIEDDPDIVDMLSTQFSNAGWLALSSAAEAQSGLQKAREQLPDLIILDLMLPGGSGLDVCRILKSRPETEKIPIIVLSAKAEEIDRIVALELGADDYVTKPFSPREVILRTKAILKRCHRSRGEDPVTVGNLAIDPARHTVLVSGKPVQLTTVEFKLLNVLMHRCGRVEPRERLLADVWGYDHSVESRTIDTHMNRLRKKLGSAGKLIETIRGFGYRLRRD